MVAAALRAVLEFKFSLRSHAAVRFKGKWLHSSNPLHDEVLRSLAGRNGTTKDLGRWPD
jgi:hypothetical protein